MIDRNDPCFCNSGKKWKKCHYPIKESSSPQQTKELYRKRYGIIIKSEEQITKIRAACRLSAKILKTLCQMAKAGVTTNELDQVAYQMHMDAGAKPAPLGYGSPPYPKSICTSLNEVICHGIPDDKPLVEGDIVNIDVSSLLNGYYGDCSAMVIIGKTSPERENVVLAAKESLEQAEKVLRPGTPINEIANMIEARAALRHCSVVTEFTGHGIGAHLHEEPQIIHAYNQNTTRLVPGMTFTIEPMINAGCSESQLDPVTGWIVKTLDNKPSAQWEHTYLITETGYEILTIDQ